MARQPSTAGKVQCPQCGRWCYCLWRIEGDDVALCADCIGPRRTERQRERIGETPMESGNPHGGRLPHAIPDTPCTREYPMSTGNPHVNTRPNANRV